MALTEINFFRRRSIATGVAPNKVSLIVFVALTGVGAAANTPTGERFRRFCFLFCEDLCLWLCRIEDPDGMSEGATSILLPDLEPVRASPR